jgi:exopolyphosphatase/guanosine-5'-triphosphate,3'-diphosphate pyrophosphatase
LKLDNYDRHLIHLSRISATSVYQVAASFQSMNKDQLANLGYMHPGRVDVITAGALVLSRIMAATGASEFIASESDILDGIAWSLSK